MHKICGFAVVRCANRNFLDDLTPPRIDEIYYHGVSRQCWTDICDCSYQENLLPEHYRKLYQSLHNTRVMPITKELEVAQDLLRFSNKAEPLNEMIVIYSKILEKSEGSFITDIEIKWLGEDIKCAGMGSILMEGIFTKPYIFPDLKKYLNQYGLFDINSPIIDTYIAEYTLNEKKYNLEIFSDRLHLLDRVWVGIPEI